MKPLLNSRRSFLATATSITIALPRLPLIGKPVKTPEFSFIIVSDTHLGRKDNDSAARQWKKTATELAKAPGDFILHLGDVVDQGRELQYPIYQGIRDTIGKPVHEIPGNHDPAELFAKHLRKDIDTAFDHQGVRFVLFNNASTESHDGFLTSKQIQWIDEQCAEAKQRGLLVVLCTHVPVHNNRHPDRGWYVKPKDGQKEFYEAVAKHAPNVVGLFHGHFHNGLRGWHDRAPMYEICFPSVIYNLNRKLEEQKAPGFNPDEFRPGYVHAQCKDGQLHLQYRVTGGEASIEKKWKVA